MATENARIWYSSDVIRCVFDYICPRKQTKLSFVHPWWLHLVRERGIVLYLSRNVLTTKGINRAMGCSLNTVRWREGYLGRSKAIFYEL